MRKQIFKKIFLTVVVGLFCFAMESKAATFYVSPDGNDSNDGLSTDNPKQHIAVAMQSMSSGDTLILKNGIYTGANNMVGDDGSPKVYLPSGTQGNFTTIRAENVGQAIIDGEYARRPFSMGNTPTYRNYLHVDGIHFRNGSAGVFSIAGNYNRVSNCGFEDGVRNDVNTETAIASVVGGSTYSLIEDSWVWGKGRYGFYTSSVNGGTNHVIFRRVVVRLDATPDGWQSAGLRFYNSNFNAMQNCIVIDSLTGANPGPGCTSGVDGAALSCLVFAQGGGSSSGEWGHIFNGNIGLNNPDRPSFTDDKGNDTAPITWSNSVWWDNLRGLSLISASTDTLNMSKMLIGGKSNPDKLINSAIYYTGNRYSNITLSDSTVLNTVSEAFGPTGFSANRTISNVTTFNTGGTSCNAGDQCIISGLENVNPAGTNIKYLPRSENGYTRGPNILYQIGGSGKFYDDEGWNDQTEIELWPLPNEQMWGQKMKTYDINSVSGDRGFAALADSTQTPLTDYIWGYLGTPKPDIYADIVPPAAPSGLAVN